MSSPTLPKNTGFIPSFARPSANSRAPPQTDVTVSFDVGWDSSGEWSRRIYELFPYLDVLLMNETECLLLQGNLPDIRHSAASPIRQKASVLIICKADGKV